MVGSLNKVMIIGNLGRDPELRYTSNGTPVISFSVATSYKRKGPDGEIHEQTEWFNVVAWDKLAETMNQYLTKGQKVFVEGRLQIRSWEGQDKQKKSRTEIVASSIIMLSPKNAATSAPVEREFTEDESEVDDLPF